MHRARTFFYVAAGVFLLALSYNLGARSAGAANGGPSAVALQVFEDSLGDSQWYALASNGDVYHVTNRLGTWNKNSNIFSPDPPAKLPWPDPPGKATRPR